MQVITRNRSNAKTLFKGIPARFKFKVADKFFPYSKEAHEHLSELKKK